MIVFCDWGRRMEWYLTNDETCEKCWEKTENAVREQIYAQAIGLA